MGDTTISLGRRDFARGRSAAASSSPLGVSVGSMSLNSGSVSSVYLQGQWHSLRLCLHLRLRFRAYAFAVHAQPHSQQYVVKAREREEKITDKKKAW